MSRTETKISALKANHGDCLIIETFDAKGNDFNILIDGGTFKTFHYFLSEKIKLLGVIHLLILTHIDDDHIAGLIEFVKSSLFPTIRIDKLWVNGANLLKIDTGSPKITYGQGVEFEKLLITKGIDSSKINKFVCEGMIETLGEGLLIQVISPPSAILDKLYKDWPIEDLAPDPSDLNVAVSSGASSQISRGKLSDLSKIPFKHKNTINSDIFNSSSLAFILTTPTSRLLFLADSRCELVEDALRKMDYSESNRLEVDFVKISHHGSIYNTSCDLLDIIKCNKFLISTNGGNGRSRHPDRETIARILCHPLRNRKIPVNLYFNYSLSEIEDNAGELFNEDELREENFQFYDEIDFILF